MGHEVATEHWQRQTGCDMAKIKIDVYLVNVVFSGAIRPRLIKEKLILGDCY